MNVLDYVFYCVFVDAGGALPKSVPLLVPHGKPVGAPVNHSLSIESCEHCGVSALLVRRVPQHCGLSRYIAITLANGKRPLSAFYPWRKR